MNLLSAQEREEKNFRMGRKIVRGTEGVSSVPEKKKKKGSSERRGRPVLQEQCIYGGVRWPPKQKKTRIQKKKAPWPREKKRVWHGKFSSFSLPKGGRGFLPFKVAGKSDMSRDSKGKEKNKRPKKKNQLSKREWKPNRWGTFPTCESEEAASEGSVLLAKRKECADSG